MREKHIEAKVCSYAQSKGVYQRKFSSPGHAAVPDRIFHWRGRTMYIEFKAPGTKPTPAQIREHTMLEEAGMKVHVCDNIERGYNHIREFIGEPAQPV